MSFQPYTFRRALTDRWRQHRVHHGRVRSAALLIGDLVYFLRDSTPWRRRQRYGDVEYDWDYRVDTTSATVSDRTRLLAALSGAPYQPTEPGLFHAMLDSLAVDFRRFVFIDLGSGKGRTLLMASDYPFRRILGVELIPELHAIAEQNIRKYSSQKQQCTAIESWHGDARDYEFPGDPILLYLFNPLPEDGLAQVLRRLEGSIAKARREVIVIYHNPEHEHLLAGSDVFKKEGGTHQYVVYSTREKARS